MSHKKKKNRFGPMHLRETRGRRTWGKLEVQEQFQGQIREMNSRINEPQQELPPPSLVPRSPPLFSSPPHRALPFPAKPYCPLSAVDTLALD